MEGHAYQPFSGPPMRVTVENFRRAESHRHFASVAITQGAFGEFVHNRKPTRIEEQTVRSNRDTLYSGAVFDLDAGPVTITLPDTNNRFMSMIVIDEDHYAFDMVYGGGQYTFTREAIGTRYLMTGVRIFTDLLDPNDVREVHALQDAITVNQRRRGSFDAPSWDRESHKKVRDALFVLGRTLTDSKRMFGARTQVDPVRHLIGTAMGWGGSPEKDVAYVSVRPNHNDGGIIYTLKVNDAPVDAFWSISVYNAKGCFERNPQEAYTINSTTAQKAPDGSITVQFGGWDARTANCLPVMPGWNYLVRLYRPRAEILNGAWIFPHAQPAAKDVELRHLKGA